MDLGGIRVLTEAVGGMFLGAKSQSPYGRVHRVFRESGLSRHH